MNSLSLRLLNPNWHESLWFLGQILSAEFSLKISKFFWSRKLTSIWHPAKLIQSYKKIPLGGGKDEHFSCLHISCQWVLNSLFDHKIIVVELCQLNGLAKTIIMIDFFKIISHYNNKKITIGRFVVCKMTCYKNTRIKNTNMILLLYIFLSAMIIMVANGSPDRSSVLNKCQKMEDCPAGKICGNYDHVKNSLDYMVEAEILLG